VLVIRDEAKLEQLAARLHAAEEQQDLLMEGIADGVAILCDGEIVRVNSALAGLLGIDADRLEGRLFQSLVGTADLLQVRERLQELEGAGKDAIEPFRLTLRRDDDEGDPQVRLKASPIRYLGQPAVLAIIRDVTGQARFEEELRRNEARLDAVLEAAPEGILVLVETAEGSLVHLTNQAFLDMFELQAGAVLGLPEVEILRILRHRGAEGAGVAAVLAAANRDAVRDAVPGGEGSRALDLAVIPLLDGQGRFLGRMLSCSDRSAHAVREADREGRSEELQASINALMDSCRELDRTNADLRQKMAEQEQYNQELVKLDDIKSRLLGNVSHELQTPLVSIRGYTEMILRGRLGSITEEQHKGLTLSLKNIDRLITMIDGLLNLARNERLHLTVFPLHQLVEECEDLIRPKLGTKNLTLSIRQEQAGIRVHGDREKLFQVFLNLLSNAVKYNREDGRIEVLTRPGDAGLVAVEIMDTGIGILPDDQKKIFDRFYRADRAGTAAESESGAGIGLSIVHNILRLHGCTIHVESEPGEGSTFSFTLPMAEAGDGPPDRPEEPETNDRPRLRIIRPGS
jgi:PAS domain S-box-containing protein